MPTELVERFSRKQWKDCCGKGCKKCDIAQLYVAAYGKKKGLELLNDDRAAVRKGKALKKKAKAGDGKKKAKAGDGKKKAPNKAKG